MSLSKRENPLLKRFDTPHGVPPFGEITIEDFKEAFEVTLKEAYREIDEIVANGEEATFENTIVAMEYAGERLGVVAEIFFNLNSACTSPEMQSLAQEISPSLSAFHDYITLNKWLFKRVEVVMRDTSSLTVEQQTLLENVWRMFLRGGAKLEGEKRKRFEEINGRLAVLSLKFAENTLAATNDFTLHITKKRDLRGLPESVVEAARVEAEERGMDGWLFTLHAPSYNPFMKYAENRELREKLYMAYATRCNGGERDNRKVISEIVTLRHEKAQLLGYENYADLSTEVKMAGSSKRVKEFLSELHRASRPFAARDREQLEIFATDNGLAGDLKRWDWSYYSNKLKVAKFGLDDEAVRPYFSLDDVIKGVFGLATELYGLTFKENPDIPKYHEDVRSYEVFDEKGDFLAVLYTDFFPRPNKEGGAWMTGYRGQYVKDGVNVRPVVSLVMNFTKPTADKPSLLTHNEITTLLHEFGHALHGMLSQCTYESVSGTNVQWDFVELPSQLMENWAFEKEWLDRWAKHYQTGERIPAKIVANIKAASNFQSGYACNRQLTFGFADLAWHTITKPFDGDVELFEKLSIAEVDALPPIDGVCFSTALGHIFAGGYAAGYYSYKWAEVLDADVFSVFAERGIFNHEVADSFRHNILERGGTERAMVLFKRFMGREPSINALLKRDGMI